MTELKNAPVARARLIDRVGYMSTWDRIGKSIDRMAWPERILWIVFTLGGSSVITLGNYVIEVSAAFKLFLAASFLLIVCAAGYYRLAWIDRSGRTTRSERPASHGVFLPGPTYWTLCETVTWVAFGEAVKADQIEGWMRDRTSTVDMDAGIQRAIVRVREAARRGDLYVQGQKDGSARFEKIDEDHLASNVALYFAQDKIALDGSSDIGTVLDNDLPTFNRVIFYREQVLKLWPEGGKRLEVSQVMP